MGRVSKKVKTRRENTRKRSKELSDARDKARKRKKTEEQQVVASSSPTIPASQPDPDITTQTSSGSISVTSPSSVTSLTSVKFPASVSSAMKRKVLFRESLCSPANEECKGKIIIKVDQLMSMFELCVCKKCHEPLQPSFTRNSIDPDIALYCTGCEENGWYY
ncbi:hypothetical protein Pcinc_016305 [Petrolisthes cinctipes]|uniref:Uncharacterized protein n=1 Tax=Petrolisthes cinctipes TaxID=88211 RepID=A0AAE1FRD7_PETCI|nr:hypothetical protein Pcinc_016305 [Petrolisthes cinctipes]